MRKLTEREITDMIRFGASIKDIADYAGMTERQIKIRVNKVKGDK